MGDLECWICDGEPEVKVSELHFDLEFDAYYHPECLDETGYDTMLEYEKENEGDHTING